MKRIFFIPLLCFMFSTRLYCQIVGIDVSHYNVGLDFNLAASQNKTFCWIKITEGAHDVEGLFDTNLSGAKAGKMTVGVYHVGYPTINANAIDEATHFLAFARPYIGNGFLPPALDIEADVANQVDPQTLANWILTWMQTVQAKTHVPPILYISRTYTTTVQFQAIAQSYKLWVADPDLSPTVTPAHGIWNDWTFKQYTGMDDPGMIGGKPVDFDSFHGDQNAFNTLISISSGITLYPDLTITAGTQKLSTSSAAAGSSLTVSCSEDNKGGADAAANNVTVWLSADATLDTGSAIKLGSISFPSVYANSNSLINSVQVQLPANTAPGQYYVFFYADGDNQVVESDETNNFASQIVTVTGSQALPDLLVQNAQISPNTVTPGQQVTLSCTNKNQGTGNAVASYTSIWLSADQKFDGSPVDTYLGDIAIPALTAGQSSGVLSKTVTIPTGPYAGTWYVLFGADGTGVVNESVESNNQTFIPVTFGGNSPPLAPVLTLTPACSATAGQITLNWTATAMATSYDVYRNNSLYKASVSNSQYADALVTAGQSYSYYIIANLPGSTLTSLAQTATAPNCNVTNPPGTPNLTLIPGCNGTSAYVTLRWTPEPDAISYDIYRNNVVYTTVSGINSYNDYSVSPSAPYYYYVRANNAGGGSNSATQMTTTYDCSSELPGKTTVTLAPQCYQQSSNVTTSDIVVSLSPASKTTAYNIYRNGVYFHTLFTTDSYYDNTVTPGLVYSYFIMTGNGSGQTSSDTVYATAPNCSGQPLPGAATLSLTASCDSATSLITLDWTAAANATTYDIYRNDSLYFSNVTGTEFITRDIIQGHSYRYYMIARNVAGSTASNTVSTTAATCKPPPPTIATFTPKTAIAGTLVTITGTGFDQTTAVSFGGTPAASVTVNSIGSVTAKVGTGFSGNVSVTTANGSASVPGFNYIFSLPDSNFTVKVTSATCKGSNNGFVNIKATQTLSYTATITGNGLNQPYTFTDTLTINNLAAGTYSVCITVAGQSDYNQCYNVVITEPKDLSLYATVNNSLNSVNLALSGGTQYNIKLNGVLYTTTDNTITLPLKEGNNDLIVTTDKLCQGSIEKLINVSNKIVPYPDPFQGTLNLNLGINIKNHVAVQINNVSDGKLVYSKQYGSMSGIIQLDLSDLRGGVYALKLIADNSETVFKVMKQ